MDHAPCNVIYVNSRAKDQIVQRGTNLTPSNVVLPNGLVTLDSQSGDEIITTVESILGTFTTGEHPLALTYSVY